MTEPQRTIASRLRQQATWCARLGSPLYATLLAAGADDVEAGGPCWTVLAGHDADPEGSALALRFMAGVHRLVLEGRAPRLARHYPSAGGDATTPGAWDAFRETVTGSPMAIDAPVQTNEVGRSAALVGGFLLVARETGLPLRVLELGASAGLNLRWDHYRYEKGPDAWGDQSSPVRMVDVFVDRAPPFEVAARVVERAGCDRAPIDATSADGELTLLSFVWPDQTARMAALRGAIDVARRVPAIVDASDAAEWVASRLSASHDGVATVVFHSIVMQYLGDETRARVVDTLADAGQRASRAAPLAWLRMEPADRGMEIRLTSWPGGVERLVASAGAHGRPVRWLAD